MLTMNEQEKGDYLQQLIESEECYHFQIWGTIMADAKAYLAIGAVSSITMPGVAALGVLSNAYCYIGGTDNSLNFVIVDSINVNKVKNILKIPLSSVTNKKVKKSFIPGRTIIELYIGKEKMKIALMNNTWGTDLKNQKEGIEVFSRMELETLI